MKIKYIKWHNNYDELALGESYDGIDYKKGWVLINGVLYRAECFEL